KISLEFDSTNVNTHNELGNSLVGIKKYDEAMKEYEKAIEKDRNFKYAHYNKAHLNNKFKRFDEAIENLKTVLQIDANYINAYNELGNSYRNLKNFDRAIENYKIAISIDPKFKFSYYNYGLVLQDLDQPD